MRAFLFLIQIVLVTLGAVWLTRYPGTLRIDWLGYRIETSLTVFIVGLLSGLFTLYILNRLWGFVMNFPSRINAYVADKRMRKGIAALAEADTALDMGSYEQAKAQAETVGRCFDCDVLKLNILSRAALLEDDLKTAEDLFLKIRGHPHGNIKGLYGLAEVAIKQEDYPKAYGFLQEALKTNHQVPRVLKTAFELGVRLKKYDEALLLLKPMRVNKQISETEENRYRAVIYFEQAQNSSGGLDLKEKRCILEKAHTLAPDLVPVSLMLARIYKTQDQAGKASKVIETTWALSPHPELAEIYEGLNPGDTPHARLEHMQRLMSFNPHHPQSYLMIAKFALELQMWPNARAALHRLEEEYGHTAISCRLMAQLELGEKGDEAEARKWLERALSTQADACWACTSCHVPLNVWASECVVCHSFAKASQVPYAD